MIKHFKNTIGELLNSFSGLFFLIFSFLITLHGQSNFLFAAGSADKTTNVINGKVVDAETGELLPGANIFVPNTTVGTTTNGDGEFMMKVPTGASSISVSFIGYRVKTIDVSSASEVSLSIRLQPAAIDYQPIIVSSGRQEQARTEAPIAISSMSSAKINELKPDLLYQAVNQIAGVNMVDLGNETHMMAIRQPISTKAFFLYLEDGIPIRPAGLFNHNSLYEINMTGIGRFEVIKGPASSLYGSNAIGGVVNFITPKPNTISTGNISLRHQDIGYDRVDVSTGTTLSNGLGLYAGGYISRQREGWRDHSDFDKVSFSARADYAFTDQLKLKVAGSTNHLDTDMTGSLSNAQFFGEQFTSQQTFTLRKVHATRVTATLSNAWTDRQQTDLTLFFRNNTTLQNPSYRVRTLTRDPGETRAKGEENDNSFDSFGLDMQHRLHLGSNTGNASLLSGITVDHSPATFIANHIDIVRDPVRDIFTSFTSRPDSLLADYNVDLFNIAAYTQFEFFPINHLKLVGSLRYDFLEYDFDNHLPPSAASGSADQVNNFNRMSPKVGATYDFGLGRGVYANFSQGFQPPEVSELYRNVKIPTLEAAHFNNYEIGGWWSLLQGKLNLELSAYQLDGTDEIISVEVGNDRINQNAGETRHRGIEYAASYSPNRQINFRLGASNAEHDFIDYIEDGNDFSGNEISGAPSWIANSSITYRPTFIHGLRVGVEWQHIGAYFLEDSNLRGEYTGYDIFNLRFGYQYAGVELWSNLYNVSDELYATRASFSFGREQYTPGLPRSVTFGISYGL